MEDDGVQLRTLERRFTIDGSLREVQQRLKRMSLTESTGDRWNAQQEGGSESLAALKTCLAFNTDRKRKDLRWKDLKVALIRYGASVDPAEEEGELASQLLHEHLLCRQPERACSIAFKLFNWLQEPKAIPSGLIEQLQPLRAIARQQMLRGQLGVELDVSGALLKFPNHTLDGELLWVLLQEVGSQVASGLERYPESRHVVYLIHRFSMYVRCQNWKSDELSMVKGTVDALLSEHGAALKAVRWTVSGNREKRADHVLESLSQALEQQQKRRKRRSRIGPPTIVREVLGPTAEQSVEGVRTNLAMVYDFVRGRIGSGDLKLAYLPQNTGQVMPGGGIFQCVHKAIRQDDAAVVRTVLDEIKLLNAYMSTHVEDYKTSDTCLSVADRSDVFSVSLLCTKLKDNRWIKQQIEGNSELEQQYTSLMISVLFAEVAYIGDELGYFQQAAPLFQQIAACVADHGRSIDDQLVAVSDTGGVKVLPYLGVREPREEGETAYVQSPIVRAMVEINTNPRASQGKVLQIFIDKEKKSGRATTSDLQTLKRRTSRSQLTSSDQIDVTQRGVMLWGKEHERAQQALKVYLKAVLHRVKFWGDPANRGDPLFRQGREALLEEAKEWIKQTPIRADLVAARLLDFVQTWRPGS